jgi:hypothetical protein
MFQWLKLRPSLCQPSFVLQIDLTASNQPMHKRTQSLPIKDGSSSLALCSFKADPRSRCSPPTMSSYCAEGDYTMADAALSPPGNTDSHTVLRTFFEHDNDMLWGIFRCTIMNTDISSTITNAVIAALSTMGPTLSARVTKAYGNGQVIDSCTALRTLLGHGGKPLWDVFCARAVYRDTPDTTCDALLAALGAMSPTFSHNISQARQIVYRRTLEHCVRCHQWFEPRFNSMGACVVDHIIPGQRLVRRHTRNMDRIDYSHPSLQTCEGKGCMASNDDEMLVG